MPALVLFAEYLKQKVDPQADDAARVKELTKILDLVLTKNLLTLTDIDDRPIQGPG